MPQARSKIKYLITTIAVLALLTADTGCARKEAAKNQTQTQKPVADDKAQDQVQHKVLTFNLEGLTEKGAKKWEVEGRSAEAISENEIKLDSIVARAYGEEAAATITADKGIYDKSKNNVRLEQNVKATIENTQSATGTVMPDFIAGQSNKPSDQRGPDAGHPKKTRTVITCEGEVLFDYENNHAYFNKEVKVVSDDGNIDADKITVNLDPVSKKVKEIVAEGNVKITRGENVTYSEKAIYVESERKIILVGRPRLVIYQEGGLEGNFMGK